MEKYAFWPMAVLSLGSAIGMLLSRNAVHSALLLVANFFSLAVFYVLLDAQFLAAAQVIVYAGAIMVLFLFVIMLLGVDRDETLDETIRFHRPLAIGFGAALAGVLVFTLRSAFSTTPFPAEAAQQAGGNTKAVGRLLFTEYLFPFEVTSILLLIAAIGAIVLGRSRSDDEPAADEEEGA